MADTAPSPLQADTLTTQDIAVELHLLRSRVERLERRQRGLPEGDPSESVALLLAHLSEHGPMALSEARQRFTKIACDAAEASHQAWRIRRYGAGITTLSVIPPRVPELDIAAWLREPVERFQPGAPTRDDPAGDLVPISQPRRAATLRECNEHLNKNKLAGSIDAARRRGEIVIGHLDTGRAGRPPKAIGLANEPLPTFLDGLPVRWQQ